MNGPDHKPPDHAAEVIAVEASRLQRLAIEHKHHFLAYLLEMVLLEAWREAAGEQAGACETPGAVELEPLSLDT